MSKLLQTLLVGVGGYGATYANYLLSGEFDADLQLTGVVDPFAKTSSCYEQLIKKNIPIYDSMEAYFAKHKADLTIISTPIHLHYDQCSIALENGSNVLCEKPLVPNLEALDKLEQKRGDKLLAVGFQWCYSTVMQTLKKRILSKEFGKALNLKCYVSWPRNWAYYSRGVNWAGKIKSANGDLIHDSIASNATAHYIQNMLFLLGADMESAASLTNIQAECYRANDIESFDTIAFKGKAGEAEIYYTASHATYNEIHPVMDYTFENARIWINVRNQDFICTVHHKDGRVEDLGHGLGEGEINRVRFMVKRLKGEEAHVCTAQTARPITALIDSIFNQAKFHSFPSNIIIKDTEKEATYVQNLHLDLWDCFSRNQLPSEMGFNWSQKASEIICN